MNLRNKIFKRLYINVNHRTDNTIFLAGTGRSGTTWLSNIINYRRDYRDLFEPFHSRYTPECHGFKNKQYLSPDNQDAYYYDTAMKILIGRIRNPWIDQYNATFLCRKRLVKDIRANLFLKWLKTRFPEVPLVLIIRHPCAVANSKILLGWTPDLDDYLCQDALIEQYLSNLRQYLVDIRDRGSQFEKIICQWCIETSIPAKQLTRDDAYVVFYENLCLDIRKETRNLFKWLRKPSDETVFTASKKPSAVSEPHSAVVTGKNLVSNWQGNFDSKQIWKAEEILTLFGMAFLYGADPLPKTDSIWSNGVK